MQKQSLKNHWDQKHGSESYLYDLADYTSSTSSNPRLAQSSTSAADTASLANDSDRDAFNDEWDGDMMDIDTGCDDMDGGVLGSELAESLIGEWGESLQNCQIIPYSGRIIKLNEFF